MKKKVAFGLIGAGAVVVIALLVVVLVLSKKMNASLEQEINRFLQEKVASADSEILSFEPFECFGKTKIACKSKAIVFGAPNLLNIEKDVQSKQTRAESWRFENIELDLSGRDSQANTSVQFLAKNSEIAFKISCDTSLDLESKNTLHTSTECYAKNEEFAYNGFGKVHFTLTHDDFEDKIQNALAILFDTNKEGDNGEEGEDKHNALGVRLDSLVINERANDLFETYKKTLGAENEGMLEGMLFGFALFSGMLQNELQEQSNEEIKEFQSALLNALNNVLMVFKGGYALNIEIAKKVDYEPILLPQIQERISLEWLAKHYVIDSNVQALENENNAE